MELKLPKFAASYTLHPAARLTDSHKLHCSGGKAELRVEAIQTVLALCSVMLHHPKPWSQSTISQFPIPPYGPNHS
jgi:hypothetical protein